MVTLLSGAYREDQPLEGRPGWLDNTTQCIIKSVHPQGVGPLTHSWDSRCQAQHSLRSAGWSSG